MSQTTKVPPELSDFAQLDALGVCAALSWSRSFLHAQVRAGKFPAPIKYGRRCARWPAASVRDWLAAQRPAPTAAAPGAPSLRR